MVGVKTSSLDILNIGIAIGEIASIWMGIFNISFGLHFWNPLVGPKEALYKMWCFYLQMHMLA